MARLANPVLGFKFKGRATGTGSVQIGFSKISSLKEESEVVEYREGDELITVRKLVGLSSVDNVTLERGVDLQGALLLWRYQVSQIINFSGNSAQPGGEGFFAGDGSGFADSTAARGTEAATATAASYERDFIITTGKKGEAIKDTEIAAGDAGWVLWRSWPMSYEEGEFDAQSSDVVFSTVELVHRGIGRTETAL